MKGLCDADVDFTVLKPDGSEYASRKGAELWKGKPAPAKDVIQLSVANLGLVIEPHDPAGVYRVQATAHDRNGARDVSIEQVFTVPK